MLGMCWFCGGNYKKQRREKRQYVCRGNIIILL